MKKRLTKKLSLNKATISRLENEEMSVIKGAVVTYDTCKCDTASCSIFVDCCGPTTKEVAIKVTQIIG